jgi:hypothetical protein
MTMPSLPASAFWNDEDALATRYARLRHLERAEPYDEAPIGALRREIEALEAQQIALLDATLVAHRAVLPEGERVRDVLARHGIDLPESLHNAR